MGEYWNVYRKATTYTKYEKHFVKWGSCSMQGSEGNCGNDAVTEEECVAQAEIACGEDCHAFAIRILGKNSYGSTYVTFSEESCIDQNVYEDEYWNVYRKATTYTKYE